MSRPNAKTVITVGEVLIDFFCTDVEKSLREGTHFLKQAGGAPANVSVVISMLGGASAIVGKVGADPFGDFLRQTLADRRVNTSMLVRDHRASTTLAFVSLKADGERDFVFHRGADQFLRDEDLHFDQLDKAKILHFGSATALLSDPLRKTYLKVMRKARQKRIFTSFDPNYRRDLWSGRTDEFIAQVRQALPYADFVKVSAEELQIVTGGNSNREDALKTLHEQGVKLVVVTLGKDGSLFSNGLKIKHVPSINVQSIDSTGAGDAFVGAVLYRLSQLDDPETVIGNEQQLEEIVSFANRIGARVCTQVGAITAFSADSFITDS